MLKKLLGIIFRRTPTSLRRFHARAFNDQFSVTSGAVIFNSEKRLLLLKHVFRPGSGWGIPGGFIKAGEQPETAVRRELMEEVGLELKTVEVAFVRTLNRIQQVEILFNCTSDGEAQPKSVEVESVGWFHLDELPKELSQDQHHLIKRALECMSNRPS
jgi:ADP-ribose pyrophosphatase YjhB (NUDIX family)